MKKNLLLLMFFSLQMAGKISASTTEGIRIYLDTRKYGYANIDCNLGTVPGDTSLLTKIYAHTGLCTSDSSSCVSAIIPFDSPVWEHVVGNWGNNPQDDGVGLMSRIGNGMWMLDVPSYYAYYGNPALVNTGFNNAGTVQSTPMPQGATAYTMGLVFRNSDATLAGRDSTCNDIFIWKLSTGRPEVIQSQDYSAWKTGPVSFVKIIDGIPQGMNEPETFAYAPKIFPNPFSNHTRVEFFLQDNSKPCLVQIWDTRGQLVKTLADGFLSEGSNVLRWSGNNEAGCNVADGLYYVRITAGNKTISDKIILNR